MGIEEIVRERADRRVIGPRVLQVRRQLPRTRHRCERNPGGNPGLVVVGR